ncbi:MAG: hypothetical protein HYS33_04455 [Acidobacteria bacterium]|nr:hypothetical protein [Acidobacteriota bacterium]
MASRGRLTGRGRLAIPVLLLSLAGAGSDIRGWTALASPPEEEGEISPEAAAEIFKVTPERARAGGEITLQIEGRNFARGVYVSFSHPAVQVLTTRRVSNEGLEARVMIGAKAPSGALRLYVSNTAGPVAQSQFAILGGIELPGAPPAPSTSVGGISAALIPATTAPPLAPAQATAEEAAAKAGTPQVTAVEPQLASPGSEVTLKITGRNFVQGATVAFSNPGIRVMETRVLSETELIVSMKVAEDAPTGATGLFVVNPDDAETEFPFEVAKESSAPATDSQAAPGTTETPVAEALRFEVLNLGEGIDIFQSVNKLRGTLIFTGGKLRYEEAGEGIFSAAPADIKEIDVNTVLGVNTGTFHVKLKSGKNFNFVPASLRPAETQSIIEALRRALNEVQHQDTKTPRDK